MHGQKNIKSTLGCKLHFTRTSIFHNLFIVIIIIRHELGLTRPVPTSSNSLLKGLPSRLLLVYISTLVLKSCSCTLLLHSLYRKMRR